MTKITHDRPSGDIRDRDPGPEYRSTACESTQPRVAFLPRDTNGCPRSWHGRARDLLGALHPVRGAGCVIGREGAALLSASALLTPRTNCTTSRRETSQWARATHTTSTVTTTTVIGCETPDGVPEAKG
jgi:hypothetical protein